MGPDVILTSVNSSSSSAVFGGLFLVEEVEALTTAPAGTRRTTDPVLLDDADDIPV